MRCPLIRGVLETILKTKIFSLFNVFIVLLNMTNRAQIQNVNIANFYLSVLKFGDLIGRLQLAANANLS